MKITLATVLIRCLSVLPFKALYYLAVPVGWLLWLLPWRKHAVIATNLALCLPELDAAERRRLHRRNLVEMTRLVLESGLVWYGSARRLDRLVREVNGWEHLEKACAAGRGVIVASAHLGNWEILNLHASRKLPITCLYRAPADEQVNRIITRTRQRFGGRLVASGSASMREMLTRLRRGEVAGIMFDQQPKQGEGVFAPFFARPALTMTLVNRLARRTGADVLMSTVRRLPAGRGWALDYTPADPDRVTDPDPVRAIAPLHEWLETAIRRHPAQYLWMYKRFSIRPEGEAEIYPLRRRRRSGR